MKNWRSDVPLSGVHLAKVKGRSRHFAEHQQHHAHVAVAAYFRAKHRGFNGGDAEAEIDAALNKREGTTHHN